MEFSEQSRRIIIRLVTSLLNLLIGPAGAWIALGFKGIGVYLIAHTAAKTLSAEASAKSRNIALRSYRYSPLLLLLGGLIPMFWGNWVVPVIIVPLLLGGFEGSYWCTFHGIRNYTKEREEILGGEANEEEAEERSITLFQIYELVTTCSAAALVYVLKDEGLFEYAGPIGAVLALISWLMPMGEDAKNAPLDIDTADLGSERAIFGTLTTGSFGMVQMTRTWSMRIVALNAGGVQALSILVGLSAVVGFSFKVENEKRGKKNGLPDSVVRKNNWRIGNIICMLGMSAMIAALALMDGSVVDAPGIMGERITGISLTPWMLFVAGYLVCNAGVAGILRPLELSIASGLFKGAGGEIGLRERTKFKSQAKLLSGYLALFVVPATLYSNGLPGIPTILIPSLLLAMVFCMLNLKVIDVALSRQLV